MFVNELQLGVVMCGGKSTRMGTDKGLLKLENGNTWAEHAYHQLLAMGMQAVVSIHPSQEAAYSQLFPKTQLVIDHVAIEGPLCGLFSVHTQYYQHDLLVVACDMVDISNSCLTHLHNQYEQLAGEHDFVVYQSNDNQLEPMPGYYSGDGLNKIYKHFLLHGLAKYSLKHLLELGNSYGLSIPSAHLHEFKNYNSPDMMHKK